MALPRGFFIFSYSQEFAILQYMSMRFEVPQFIDVKDKIFGPFTLNQFIFLGGGLGLGYAITRLVPTFLKYPIALIPVVLGLALAFYQVNGRPFPLIIQAFFIYLFSSKLFIWSQRMQSSSEKEATKKKSVKKAPEPGPVETPMTNDRLRDLAWNLDILEDGK